MLTWMPAFDAARPLPCASVRVFLERTDSSHSAVAAGGTGCTPPARSSAKRQQYLLCHALELAFLIISDDPEQDSRRSGLDVPLQTLNALRGRTISPSLRQAAKSGGTSIGVI